MLPDGTYDAIVVDVEPHAEGGLSVSLTILAGEHKGEVVDVRTASDLDEPFDLLGIPATLTVVADEPRVHFEP
jgi:hypothetical protein